MSGVSSADAVGVVGGISAGDLADEAVVLSPDTPALEVDAAFRLDPTLRGVVTRDGERLLLLSRQQADDRLAGRHGFGRALYTHRMLVDLMPQDTLTVESRLPVPELARLLLDRPEGSRHEDVLTVWPDRRVGLIQATVVFEHLWHQREAAVAQLAARNDELLDLADRLRATFESMSDAFVTIDGDGRITYLNAHAVQAIGQPAEALLGKRLHDFPGFLHSDFQRDLSAAMREREPVTFESLWEPDGRWFSVHAYPTPEGLAVHFRDVTRRHQLEAQLLQSQKLEAVGQLAGGVAHDFNNLLTVIDGYAAVGETRVDDVAFVQRAFGQVRMASAKAAALTAKLLAFSRKQPFQTTVAPINAIVGSAFVLIEPLIGEQVVIVRNLDPRAGHVEVDVHQLEQVIVNVAVNARDAMPDGGKLSVATEWVPDGSAVDLALEPSPYVAIRIGDEGIGMDAETVAQAFDPFFTTKPAGAGTGLGLSTSLGTIARCGGTMKLESEPGRGTIVTIYLPRTDAAVEPHVPNAARPPAGTGGENILVVEDQHEVRSLIVSVLESYGYRVTEADGPDEADQHLAARDFELLLTDVVMPGCDGATLARRALERQPGLRVLFTSGYAPDSVGRLTVDAPAEFLPKPFDANQLAGTVRSLLDAPP